MSKSTIENLTEDEIGELMPHGRKGYSKVRDYLINRRGSFRTQEVSPAMIALRGVLDERENLRPPLPETVIETALALSSSYDGYLNGPLVDCITYERETLEAKTHAMLSVIFEYGYQNTSE